MEAGIRFALAIPSLQLDRHEYSVHPDDDLDDSTGSFWKQFGPWLEIPGSNIS